MAWTYPDLRLEVSYRAPHFIPLVSTVSATSSTTTLVDTTRHTDASSTFSTSQDYAGKWLLMPGEAAVADRVRRIVSIAGATGTITFTPAVSVAPAVNDLYEIHELDPRIEHGILLQTMRQHKVPALMTLMGFTDADLEETATASWTSSNATISKITTAANVFGGKSALRTLLTGANGYAQTSSFRVDPSTQYTVSIPCRVDVGGPALLIAYDVTNSASLGTVGYHPLERPTVIQGTFNTLATTEEVALRYQGTANTDDIYWGRAHCWASTDTTINLPSHIRQSAQVRKLMSATYRKSVSGTGILNCFDAASRVLSRPYQRGPEYEIRIDPYFANPGQLELRGISPQMEMYYEELRAANDIWAFLFTAAGETSPSVPDSFDLEFASLLYIRNLCLYELRNPTGDHSLVASILASIVGTPREPGPLVQLEKVYALDADPSPPPVVSRNPFGGD